MRSASALFRARLLVTSLTTLACAASSDTPAIARQELVAEVRIGSEVRGPAYAFSEISQIAARGDAIYVVQNGVPEIRVFDARGESLRTIGRRGAGPGEFDAVQSFGLLADTLWVIDSNLRRLSFFSPTGSLLTTIPFEPISPELGAKGPLNFSYPMALMGDGSILGFGGSMARAIAEGLVTATPLLRMTRTGRTLDTLGWVPIGNENMILRSEKGTMYRGQPFSDGSLTAYSSAAQRLYVVDRHAATEPAKAVVRVTALRANGDTAWSRTYLYTPVRLDAHVADSVRTRLYQALRARFSLDEIDRALYVPAYRPPVAAVLAGDDGTLWLRWDAMTAPDLYWVLGTDGRVLAQVTAPPSVRLRWASDSTAWGEELDENDVPTLVRYRIGRAK